MKIRTYLCQLNLDNLRWSKAHTHSYTHNDIKYTASKICDLSCDSPNSKMKLACYKLSVTVTGNA